MRALQKPAIVVLPMAVLVLFLALPAGSSDGSANLPADERPYMDPAAAPPDCPGQSWRIIRLNCKKQATGNASGMYGGTPFSIACSGNKTSTTICTEHGNNNYSIMMNGGACSFTGYKVEVTETCGGVQLTIN